MPELPEVEVIKNELAEKLIGEVINNITVNWPKTFINSLSELPINSRINKISRIGKYIIIELTNNFLVIHLRMTGQIIINENADFSSKHLRFFMTMESGKYFNFYDTRKFGRIYYLTDLEFILRKIGIDALSAKLDFVKFTGFLKKYKRKIKPFLLDQQIIAGIGNIYADESLFISGIHPEYYTNKISPEDAKLLLKNIKHILRQAIKNMGTTISDYKTTGGGFGGYQHQLKVYGRKDLPCFNCATNIVKIKLNGRGTHYCPRCQPVNGVLK